MDKYKKEVKVKGNNRYLAQWIDCETNKIVISREFEIIGEGNNAKAICLSNLDMMKLENPELFSYPIQLSELLIFEE